MKVLLVNLFMYSILYFCYVFMVADAHFGDNTFKKWEWWLGLAIIGVSVALRDVILFH